MPCFIYNFFPAVGIQMKLEFFQRKFWTASRQVSYNQHIEVLAVVLLYRCSHLGTRSLKVPDFR